MSRQSCVLCQSDVDTSVSLVEWKEPVDGRRFESLPRCRDRRGCQERVALIGEEWPVVATGDERAVAQRRVPA